LAYDCVFRKQSYFSAVTVYERMAP
jgi:hypothetical protein